MPSWRCLASTAWSPVTHVTGFSHFFGTNLEGYDTVSCDEVAANHFYYTQDGGIVEGRRFSDANTRASMANLEYGLQGKKQRLTSIFDYDRLDELV